MPSSDLQELAELFRPAVLAELGRELRRLLSKPIPAARFDAWIALVEGLDVGRLKKSFALHALRKKRKEAERGRPVALSPCEERFVLEKAGKHLPPALVAAWLASVRAHAAGQGGTLRLSDFDDAMLPEGAPPLRLDERLRAFDVGEEQVKDVLRAVRRSLGSKVVPDAALRDLASNGIRFE